MQEQNSIALKEWDVVCAALASGQQRILLRKGGIQEGPDGFRPEHEEFWLYPTAYHQSQGAIRPEFSSAADSLPQADEGEASVPIRHYVRVDAVHWVEKRDRLPLLKPFHILTEATVEERFSYKTPGLYVLVVSVFSLPRTVSVPHDSRYDGCRSWVELNEPLPTAGLAAIRRRGQITDDIDRLLNH